MSSVIRYKTRKDMMYSEYREQIVIMVEMSLTLKLETGIYDG
jgi:hypothetical protein